MKIERTVFRLVNALWAILIASYLSSGHYAMAGGFFAYCLYDSIDRIALQQREDAS